MEQGDTASFVNYPTNQPGVTYSRQIDKIYKFWYDIFVVSDEASSRANLWIIHVSIAEHLPETILDIGLSKSHDSVWLLFDFQCSFIFLPSSIKVTNIYNSCSNTAQFAAIEALSVGKDDAQPMKVGVRKVAIIVF